MAEPDGTTATGVPVIGRRGAVGLAAAALAAPLAAPAVAQAQELLVWSGYPEMEPFYERVGERMGGRVQVGVQAIPLREHERRIALALPGGSAASVLEMQSSGAQRYVEAGLLAKAPDAVAAFVRNERQYDPFFARSASYEGAVHGVPVFRGQGALFYNTAMFAAAGLQQPPRTMQEYTTYAERLTVRDASGKTTVAGWSLRLSGGGQGVAEKFWTILHQYGGAVVRGAAGGKWASAYANEAGRQALGQYLDLVHTKRAVQIDSPADAEAFQRGQAAMFIRESWVIGDTAKKAPDLKYATAPLPVGTIVAPVFLYTPTSGRQGELAWAYALAANEPENLSWLLDNVGWLPNRRDVDYGPVISKTPPLGAFVSLPAGHTLFEVPAIAPADEILTRLAARLVRAYADPKLAGNAAGIDAALKEAAAETDGILQREGLLARG